MFTPQQALDRELAARLAGTDFPMGSFPLGSRQLFLKAVKFNSIARIRCHPTIYRNLLTWNDSTKFKMLEVSLIIDILRAATPVEMDQSLEENVLMLETIVDPILSEWNRIQKEVREPIERKINALVKAQQGAPIGKQIFKPEA